MYGYKKKSIFVGVASLLLLTFLIAACGSTTAGSTSATATPTCPANRFKAASGTVQSISGTTLQLKSAQGAMVQASYTSTTRFQRETTTTTAALKGGLTATIIVSQNADNTYTATLITLRGTGNTGAGGGFGGFGGGGFGGRGGNGTPGAGGAGAGRAANCFTGQRGAGLQGGNGAAGAAGATGGSTSTARNIAGTIGQLTGSTLTVTDTQGSDYSVTVNSSTKIIQFQTATASALQTGASLTLTGAAASNGSITAQNITILPSGTTAGSRG